MKKTFTAVVSRNETFATPFETEPYECAWAGEARWFIRLLKTAGAGRLRLRAQLSPDGLHWCDAEGPGLTISGEGGLHSLPVANFGGWLRLRGEIEGDGASFTLIVHLVLKE